MARRSGDGQSTRVREVLPGVFHWSAIHPEIEVPVHCHYLETTRTLLDPLPPEEGLDWFERRSAPRHILLTNRLHSRASALFATRFGCDIWCNAEGLDHFGADGELPGFEVHGFRAGDELFGGVRSIPIGELCPDETAFWIAGAEPALAIADGIVRNERGELCFVPDPLIGDDPEAIKRALRAAYRRLLSLEFDHLLFAHGEPWIGGGKRALSAFVGA
jgi:hypothetical protein